MKKKSILIIESNYYSEISNNLFVSAKEVIEKNNYKYEVIKVPGALEIPVTLEKYKDEFIGFIILGCVIKGETSHNEIVQNITSSSIYNIVNKNQLAIGFGLLTVENMKQAEIRSSKNMKNVGGKSAEACIKMINILKM